MIYVKREERTTNFRRKLEQELISLQSKEEKSANQTSELEFSFKKERSICNNDKNTTLQTEASETQVKNRESYSRANSKGKLRKFNSLVTLNRQAQSNAIPFTNRPNLKKNASNYK
jgi:hypothetical protein